MRAQALSFLTRRPVLAFAVIGAGAVALYLAVFALVIDKPLTTGLMGQYFAIKGAMADRAGPGKVMVVAGSNGRYSHSCAVISADLSRPCVNMSVAATVGTDYIFRWLEPRIGKGDLIYLPLEYPYWTQTDRIENADDMGPWLFRNDRAELWALGPRRAVSAAFAFDLRFLMEGITETRLDAAGRRRREGVETLNAFGDETVNTPERARAYRRFVAALPWNPPQAADPAAPTARRLPAFVALAKSRGATVVCGLPTTFNDTPVPEPTIQSIEAICRKSGAGFLRLPNNSQYPRAMFHDSRFHLQTPGQAAHSHAVAAGLRAMDKAP